MNNMSDAAVFILAALLSVLAIYVVGKGLIGLIIGLYQATRDVVEFIHLIIRTWNLIARWVSYKILQLFVLVLSLGFACMMLAHAMGVPVRTWFDATLSPQLEIMANNLLPYYQYITDK
jgi:hypothetical protein